MTKKQQTPTILGFYGQSGIGKTYLVKKIVAQLISEGFHAAVIKVSDKAVSIDTEGKDTYLYGQAGAETVVFSSASETTFLVKQPLPTSKIVQFLSENEEYDFIFIEGALEDWIPKIRLGDMALRENTLFTYDGNYEALIAQIRNHSL
ncbi:MAG: molybdopterin-guanine dinucleotide biosynthesis protein B [Pelolinea sp.]|jgi:molybdopterin-guanine dinucleotide biosynthesis protein B|nr:molybdopterin-guanine dinucleotide biosynthesis protein B [Pelolinea sp.]